MVNNVDIRLAQGIAEALQLKIPANIAGHTGTFKATLRKKCGMLGVVVFTLHCQSLYKK